MGIAVAAVIFDFNGTLSDDEPLLAELFTELAAEQLGLEISHESYLETLAGLSDPEIAARLAGMAGRDDASGSLASRLLASKISAYRRRVEVEPRITPEASSFVRAVAARVPVALVTGAVHEEVDTALQAAGIGDLFAAVVAGDDTRHGKPDPEGLLLARAQLGLPAAGGVVVFEDSAAGLEAVRAAGMRGVKVGTDQLERAEGLYERIIPRLGMEEGAWLLQLLPGADQG